MFFEFIIALFAHESLSREFVILFSDSILREIDENSKKMFDFKRSLLFFFLILIIFHFEKAIFEFVINVNDVVDELMTNRNTLKTICDSLTKYNHIRICRTCFVFYFFFRRILHFDNHAMCSRFSHVLHILCFSMIDESHSLMWCFMTYFSHMMTIEQCFFMCSCFWQLKYYRKMQFLINRSHFLISKIFIRFSKNIRLIIFTMIIFICNVK
jgi:hypothetical protein